MGEEEALGKGGLGLDFRDEYFDLDSEGLEHPEWIDKNSLEGYLH